MDVWLEDSTACMQVAFFADSTPGKEPEIFAELRAFSKAAACVVMFCIQGKRLSGAGFAITNTRQTLVVEGVGGAAEEKKKRWHAAKENPASDKVLLKSECHVVH